MNLIEKKLVTLAKRMKSKGHIISVKAEFEAEGTRSDELLRLVEVIFKCNLQLTLKIGGCEAKKDLYEARQFGATNIVAPMIESPYALQKFENTIESVYPGDEQSDVNFYFNIETLQAYKNIEEIINVAKASSLIKGIVFGRTDFCNSLNLNNNVNHEQVTSAILSVSKRIKDLDLDLIVGGAISIASVDILKKVAENKLSKFETRKIVFRGESLYSDNLEESLLDAVHFEILWLLNKRNYYRSLQAEDQERINTLENRWGVLEREVAI